VLIETLSSCVVAYKDSGPERLVGSQTQRTLCSIVGSKRFLKRVSKNEQRDPQVSFRRRTILTTSQAMPEAKLIGLESRARPDAIHS
jgi:hypothetical protein